MWLNLKKFSLCSAVFSGGAGGARAPPEFGGSQKGQSQISAYQSLAITTNTPRFEKLNTALPVPYLAGVLGVPEHPRNLGVHKRGKARFLLIRV